MKYVCFPFFNEDFTEVYVLPKKSAVHILNNLNFKEETERAIIFYADGFLKTIC